MLGKRCEGEIALLAVTGVYATTSWRRGGQTIGMKPWRLYVVTGVAGEQVSWGRLWLRYGVGIVSLLCAGNGVEREKSVLPDFLGIGDVAFAYSSDQGEYVQGLLDLLLIRNGKTHVQNLERRRQGLL